MIDSNDNVAPLPGTFSHAVSEVLKKNPEKAIILYSSADANDPDIEHLSIEFTGGLTFKDFAAHLLSLQTFLNREYL